jgi:hypothetical protein
MDDPRNNPHIDVIEACIERLKQGSLPPWKVEEELVSDFGIDPPENFRVAALCRRGFLEEVTGEGFHAIELPEKPFKLQWHCPKDDLVWELDARDEYHTCSLCRAAATDQSLFCLFTAHTKVCPQNSPKISHPAGVAGFALWGQKISPLKVIELRCPSPQNIYT